MDFLKNLFDSFIPHAENDYKPHFFRTKAVITVALIILLLAVGAFAVQRIIVSNNDLIAAVISSVLADLANGDRLVNGLGHLAVSPTLQYAAQLKAKDMATKSYFAHTSPEGLNPWHWFKEAGYTFAYAGENLAVRFSDSADVERAWMNSPTHRANILSSHFTEIGIATADGMYKGEPVVFVVQLFGRPITPAPKPAATTSPFSNPLTVVEVKEPTATGTPSTVAGASAEKIETPAPRVIVEDDTFIAVKNEPATVTPFVASAGSASTWFERVMASPRTFMNTLYVILAMIIIIALAVMVGVEIKNQHPLNVFWGVLLLVLMALILYFWETLAPGTLEVL